MLFDGVILSIARYREQILQAKDEVVDGNSIRHIRDVRNAPKVPNENVSRRTGH